MTRVERRFVFVLLTLLAVPGLIGFELWPLTGWRLFSLARDDTQTAWVLEAVSADGDATQVDPEQLPLKYRLAEFVLAKLPGASEDRREEVCQALLEATIDVVEDAETLRLIEDRQRLRRTDGGAEVEHDPTVLHACSRPS